MNLKEVDEVLSKNLNFCGKEPDVGEYFGVITKVNYLVPYCSAGVLYRYDVKTFLVDQYPLLFKRIDEETIIEVFTGIPFLFGPSIRPIGNVVEQQEAFQKHRKIGLYFNPSTIYKIIDQELEIDKTVCLKDNQVYLRPDEKFKMLYSKEMSKGLKEQLKKYAEEAHKKFDDALLENINITASDISSDALEVALSNAKENNADINFVNTDIYKGINKKFDCIISNPPYISKNEKIMDIVYNNEPHLALFADNNGLYFYEEIIKNSKNILKDKYLICFEIGESEAESVTSYAYKYLNNPKVIVKKDLEKRDRMIFIHNFE